MHNLKHLRLLLALLLSFLLAGTLTACDLLDELNGKSTDESFNQILGTCVPDAEASVEYVSIDTSGSSGLSDNAAGVVRSRIDRAAVCGSRLIISTFAGAATTAVPVYDRTLALEGNTDIVRADALADVVDATWTEIEEPLRAALETPPTLGTDVISTFDQVADLRAQLDPSTVITAVIITDGMETRSQIFTPATLTDESVARLVETNELPDLSGIAELRFVGLGQVLGEPLPAASVRSLRVLFSDLCAKSGALSCLASSDFHRGW